MKKIKNNKTIIIITGAIILLILLIVLLNTNIINFKSNKNNNNTSNNETTNNNNNNNNNDEITENNNETTIENNTPIDDKNTIKDLSIYGEPDNSIITEEKNSDYTFKIQEDNSIIINEKNKINNISNAKSIKLFSPPSPYSILYILTENGNLYKYETSNYRLNNYSATKIAEYNNIEQIITYKKRSTEGKGGCDQL